MCKMVSEPGQGGTIQKYGERGVWVPDGMTVDEIMIGADALIKGYDANEFEARNMVIAVLGAIRRNSPPETTESI